MTISNCKRCQSLFLALLLLPLFSCQILFNSLWPHGLQHTRPPCSPPSPEVCPSSHPLNRWCHPTISSSVTPFSSCPQSFPTSEYFHIRQLKYWSFSINPSNECSGLIFFWTDWFDLLAVQVTLKSLSLLKGWLPYHLWNHLPSLWRSQGRGRSG